MTDAEKCQKLWEELQHCKRAAAMAWCEREVMRQELLSTDKAVRAAAVVIAELIKQLPH